MQGWRERERGGGDVRDGVKEQKEKPRLAESVVVREETAVRKQSVVVISALRLHQSPLHLSGSPPSSPLRVARREVEHNVQRQCEMMKNNSCIQSCLAPPPPLHLPPPLLPPHLLSQVQ